MAAEAVEFADVSFDLPGGRRLLNHVSFRVEAGTTTALLGRSGSGKTTLLRTVNQMVRPTEGRVQVGSRDVALEDPIALRRRIGYVIQESGLFPHMRVGRNAALALELAGAQPAERDRRTAEVLRLTGLTDDFAGRYPWQLSGGQRQRVGVARALASEPSVLLMDEPFGALDPLTRAEMQAMLRKLLHEAGTTTLMVTHDLDEALYLADRVVLLENGAVVADLAREAVRSSSNPAMRAYVEATHPQDVRSSQFGRPAELCGE